MRKNWSSKVGKIALASVCILGISTALAQSGTQVQTQVNGITIKMNSPSNNQATVKASIEILPYGGWFPQSQTGYGEMEFSLVSKYGQSGEVCSNAVQQSGNVQCIFSLQMPPGNYTLKAAYSGAFIGTVTYLQSSNETQVVISY